MAGMGLMRCKICDRDEKALFKVNLKKRGRIKICRDCLDLTEFGSELLRMMK
jgi:ribosome-binding protein aMBF1 (putative translation factor)